jgi:hypothetical protein
MARSPERATRRLEARKGREAVTPCREQPKLDLRRQASGQLGSDCRKVVRRRAGEPPVEPGASCPRYGEMGSTCGVDAAKAACPVTERLSGARVVSRLQKSVRSIFPELQRGAPRGKPRERGVARTFGSSPGRGRVAGFGRKGARGLSRTVTGTASSSLGRKVENRTDGRRPGLRPGATSNEVASSGVLVS